jgi:hypothetical protein
MITINRTSNWVNRIGGVMVSVLASSVVKCGIEPQSGQTKDYEISIYCFSTKHSALRRKSEYWLTLNRIGGVMVSMLDLSAGDRGFEPQWGQSKEYRIGICCFSAKNAALRSKNKNWLSWNQGNVSEWSDMSTHELLFQWANKKCYNWLYIVHIYV